MESWQREHVKKNYLSKGTSSIKKCTWLEQNKMLVYQNEKD
jgi:hypothetical protein